MNPRSKIASIATIIVLLAAGTAGIVYAATRDHKKPVASTNQTASNNQPANNQTTTPTQNNQQFLNIPEWGVKVPLGSAINDLYYSISDNLATFSTRTLADKYDCRAENVGLHLGLARFSAKSSGEENVQPSFKQIGAYWYSLGESQASCLDSDNQAAYDAINQVNEPLKSALLSIEQM